MSTLSPSRAHTHRLVRKGRVIVHMRDFDLLRRQPSFPLDVLGAFLTGAKQPKIGIPPFLRIDEARPGMGVFKGSICDIVIIEFAIRMKPGEGVNPLQLTGTEIDVTDQQYGVVDAVQHLIKEMPALRGRVLLTNEGPTYADTLKVNKDVRVAEKVLRIGEPEKTNDDGTVSLIN